MLSGSSDDVVLRNEFALVHVSIDRRGRTPRLRVEDGNAAVVYLFDPLELAVLAAAGSEALSCCMERGSHFAEYE